LKIKTQNLLGFQIVTIDDMIMRSDVKLITPQVLDFGPGQTRGWINSRENEFFPEGRAKVENGDPFWNVTSFKLALEMYPSKISGVRSKAGAEGGRGKKKVIDVGSH
jgi:hypothetical protein